MQVKRIGTKTVTSPKVVSSFRNRPTHQKVPIIIACIIVVTANAGFMAGPPPVIPIC